MKKLLYLMIAIVIAIPVFAVSNCMNYQAVINKADGTPAANANIGMKFSIISDSSTLFEETATVQSDDKGFVKYAIGSNTTNGLSSVNWDRSDIMLQVDIDLTGGSDYTTMYSTEIQSVPTALYANTSRRSIDTEAMLLAYFDQLMSDIDKVYIESQDNINEVRDSCMESIDQIATRTVDIDARTKEMQYMMDDIYVELRIRIAELEQQIQTLTNGQ